MILVWNLVALRDWHAGARRRRGAAAAAGDPAGACLVARLLDVMCLLQFRCILVFARWFLVSIALCALRSTL